MPTITITDRAGLENISLDLTGTYELGANIDLSGSDWVPIGTFTGTLDGKGYSISNLTINTPSDDAGLFYRVKGATISNLNLVNVNISGLNAGALIGYISSTGTVTTVTNCGSSGIISGGDIGGLVGYVSKIVLSKCYSTCTISGGSAGNQGGLIGTIRGTSSVTDCYAMGNVSGYTVGGFAGYIDDVATTNCYSMGLVSGINETFGFASAYSATLFTSCYWDTQTSGTSTGVPSGITGVTGLTTANMLLQASYTGWDFTTIWSINSVSNSGYPYFQWQTIVETKPATNVAKTTATLTGIISGTATNVGFNYDTSILMASSISFSSTLTVYSGYYFQCDLSGLTPNRDYYFQATADGMEGEMLNFNTFGDNEDHTGYVWIEGTNLAFTDASGNKQSAVGSLV
jgi:hypothetical protein